MFNPWLNIIGHPSRLAPAPFRGAASLPLPPSPPSLHRRFAQRRRRDIFVDRPKKDFQAPSGAASLAHGQHLHANLHSHRVRRRRAAKLIQPEHNDELQKYITGIVSAQKQKLIVINNMPDHLHLLVGLRPDSLLSDLVRDVKAGSSKFINEKRWVAGKFSWQEGSGAFSYSRSQLGTVIRYIENQQKHHAKKSFREEYTALLEKFGVDYDRRYIFKTDEV